jgi:GT2 family glycosyltransferase
MKVTMVIVLYKLKCEESKTFTTLENNFLLKNEGANDVEIILYDNSPDKQEFHPEKYAGTAIRYVHDQRNLGIVTAYNYAFTAAKQNGSEWLLLLDHDTDVTAEYLETVRHLDEKDKSIAAIVPKVNYENQMISPVYSHSLRPLQGDMPAAGLQEKPVMAINSGALVRVSFLNEIGGFNEEFPLDYLDHWLFHEVYAKGYKVRLLNVALEHELSVMDYNRVSFTRYKSILESEMKFFKNYHHELYHSYRLQLVKRFLKQVIKVKNKKIAFYTLRRLLQM